MAKKKTTTKRKVSKPRVETEFPRSKVISYKNSEYLAKFLNDRAKVYDRKRTSFSAKQQRKLSREIKRARHLGLLPFKSSL